MIPCQDFPKWAARLGHNVSIATHLKYWLFRPGYRFVHDYRVYKRVKSWPICGRALGSFLWRRNCIRFSSEIAQNSVIGAGLYTPHPYGIVIGLCEIGEDVEILQNVTIGKLRASDSGSPKIGHRAKIGAGVVILGDVEIGNDAVIGANAVVLSNVPDKATAVGNPARVLSS